MRNTTSREYNLWRQLGRLYPNTNYRKVVRHSLEPWPYLIFKWLPMPPEAPDTIYGVVWFDEIDTTELHIKGPCESVHEAERMVPITVKGLV